MSQLIKIFLLLINLMIFSVVVNAANLEGKLEYQIPIDYSKFSGKELLDRAGISYQTAVQSSNNYIDESVTEALNIYRILAHIDPKTSLYQLRLGVLYDHIGKDVLAKSYLYRAIELDSKEPENYFRLGEYYYKRTLYRKALKAYQKSLNYGYSSHYETLYKLGDIYSKFGDTKSALKYLNRACNEEPNDDIFGKIEKIMDINQSNSEYYSRRPDVELRENKIPLEAPKPVIEIDKDKGVDVIDIEDIYIEGDNSKNIESIETEIDDGSELELID